MEIVDLCQLRSRDLDPLLEEEKDLWRSRLRWDYAASASLIRRYLDDQLLGGYAALEASRPVGYCFFVYEEDKALIGSAFVASSCRSRNAEEQLLTCTLDTLQATPGIRRIETQLMNFGGLPIGECFRAKGFLCFSRRFLTRSLEDWSSAQPAAEGVLLQPWESRWFSETAELLTRAYRGHVDSRISEHYRTASGAAHFLENLVRYPGCGTFLPQSSFLAFRAGGRRPCGIVMASAVETSVGHVTQLCVDREHQGIGIGRGLMDRAIRSLLKAGFGTATLTVSDDNTQALDLYERMGFSTLHGFPAFAWDAPERG